MSKTWLITGAGRGIGASVARAALAAGDKVVASARDSAGVEASLGGVNERLLSVNLDVTDELQIADAVQAAVQKFGAIDVLVNNAGYGHMGLFEESHAGEISRQFEANVFGLFAVTRAVLPQMRRQRSGHIFNLSSTAGVRGLQGGSLYCASKFAVEGFSESLALELAPFGIKLTIVRPGPFRTDFLDPSSARFCDGQIADYAEMSAAVRSLYEGRNHLQAGDPDKLGDALVRLSRENEPPLRFAAGSNAVEVVATKIATLQAELERWRALSVTTDGDY